MPSKSYIMLFILLTCMKHNAVIPCADHERQALLEFKNSFHIDCAYSATPFVRPKVNPWSLADKGDCCSWDGVECNEKTGQVTGLDLSSTCLHGTFPPNSSLFRLTQLEELNLANNHFNFSQIPSQLGKLSKLKSLNLSNSAFSGQIPSEISKLSQLLVLDLSNSADYAPYNKLHLRLHDPSIDMLLQNLTSLQKIFLRQVDMYSPFPNIITNFTSLTALSLSLTDLYGQLPPDLFRLPRLELLDLAGNTELTGSLPRFQWHCPLKHLVLSITSLTGELPPSIGKLEHLEKLELGICQFSGLLPSSLGNLTSLTYLLLDETNFQGDIFFSLTNLTNLKYLGLSYLDLDVKPKQLFSQLPSLYNLTGLGLAGIDLESELPSLLANHTNLELLDLGDTKLMGTFPKWLANFTQLRVLYLNDNQLIGPIPSWVSKLTNLNLLHLSGNNFFGNFETFFNLKNLLELDLSDNTNITFPPYSRTNNASNLKLESLELSGCNLTEFPQFLRYQNRLQFLFLGLNNIKGKIPQWFVDITKESLQYIDLSRNYLTGFEKPTVVLPWTNLEAINLSSNKFRGELPIPPDSMEFYILSSNLFTGVIPNQICNVRSLVSLELSENRISGQIPDCIVNKLGNSLQMLDLQSNNLNGSIPPIFARSCRLKLINLGQNQLQGELPRSLANCSMLEVLDIQKNLVNDTFPSWLGSLPKLQVLVLSHNHFHGSIGDPKSGNDFRLLRIFDLSYNLFTGDLPSRYLQNWHEMRVTEEDQSDSSNTVIYYFYHVGPYQVGTQHRLDYSITITNKGRERQYMKLLKVFRVVDFSSNKFTGRIPEVVGNLQGLQALNLSNNFLNGRIPFSIANITDLESLDLSLNCLSGEIPLGLSQLTFLEVFNVSYNSLEGPIPQGNQFNTFDNSSFEGNLGLCGHPLSKDCGNANVASSTHTVTGDLENEDVELIDWIIRSLGCISGCIVGFVIGKLYITDKYHEWFMETFGR